MGGLKRLFIMIVFPISPLKSQFGKMYVVTSLVSDVMKFIKSWDEYLWFV